MIDVFELGPSQAEEQLFSMLEMLTPSANYQYALPITQEVYIKDKSLIIAFRRDDSAELLFLIKVYLDAIGQTEAMYPIYGEHSTLQSIISGRRLIKKEATARPPVIKMPKVKKTDARPSDNDSKKV